MSKQCVIAECSKPSKAHGLCGAHYARLRRHGDPLLGRTSPGDVAKYFQEIVLTHDGDECLIWPYARNDAGYGNIFIEGRNHTVSRLVCQHVCGPAPSPVHHAAHSCGKGHMGCVAKKHLSWKEPVDNYADKKIHGTVLQGEKSPMARLTASQVNEIRCLKGMRLQRELASQYGVSQTTVSLIHRGQTWRGQ